MVSVQAVCHDNCESPVLSRVRCQPVVPEHELPTLMAIGNRDSKAGQAPAFRSLGFQGGVSVVSRPKHADREVNLGEPRVRGIVILQLGIQPLHTRSKTAVVPPVRHLHEKQTSDRILKHPQVPAVHGVHGYEVQLETRSVKKTTGLEPPGGTILDVPVRAKAPTANHRTLYGSTQL